MAHRTAMYKLQAERGWSLICCPGQILTDSTVLILSVDAVVVTMIYLVEILSMLKDVEYAIRNKSLPYDHEKLLEETVSYSLTTSMIDVPGMTLFRFFYCILVWMRCPDRVALIPILISIVHICYKSQVFVYTWDVEGYEYFYADAWGIMGVSLCFCWLEVVVSLLANIKMYQTRKKNQRFRVAGDRCPLCTLPLDQCPHKIIPGKGTKGMKVINMWDQSIFRFWNDWTRCIRMVCCCSCPCIAGEVAEGLERPPFLFCCWYCGLMPGCICGTHAVIGMLNRTKLREMDKLEGSYIRDFIYHWFCCTCALIQELAQLEKMKADAEAAAQQAQLDDKAELHPADDVQLTQLVDELLDADGNTFGDENAQKTAEKIHDAEVGKAGKVNSKLAKIREKQFREDLEIAMQELKQEHFEVLDDPGCPDGSLEVGDYGVYQKDRKSSWVTPANSGPNSRWRKGGKAKKQVLPDRYSSRDLELDFPAVEQTQDVSKIV